MAYPSLLALALATAAAFAQTPPSAPTGSIAGVVTEAATGQPTPDVEVFTLTKVRDRTDAQGRYTLHGLGAGQHRVVVWFRPPSGRGIPTEMSRFVTLTAGQELTGIDFRMRLPGRISGTVLDKNKEPVPGVWVLLIARGYWLGAMRYMFRGMAETNDQGAYVLDSVRPGRGFLLWAVSRKRELPAISDVPADPKLRRSIPAPTFYPNSPLIEGAQPLTLRPGERREAVDILLLRSPSYCVDGVFEAGPGAAPLRFTIAEQQPTSGLLEDGGMFVGSPGGTTGPDGKIRICNLAPGEYRLTGMPLSTGGEAPLFFGVTSVVIGDRDLHDLRFPTRPGLAVSGEVVWEGAPPDRAAESKLTIELRPMTRAPFMGEVPGLTAGSSLPGQFAFPKLSLDDYSMRVHGLGPEFYIKDITYAGRSILHEPLRVGSASGDTGIRIAVARDGAVVSSKVADKDGNPVADAAVVLMPAYAAAEAALADTLVTGRTDQNGAWSSARLAPGKYYALATDAQIDKGPECIGALWRARIRAQEIDLAPKATLQLNLVPAALE